MVNQPEGLVDSQPEETEGDSQFATSQGGEGEGGESLEKLLDLYGGIRKFAEGEVLTGKVLKITSTM